MSTLTAHSLLQAWETALGEPPVRRPLTLLHAAWPDVEPRSWGALPIGERDRWLLTLYESLFGSELHTVTDCPACRAPLESSFATDRLRQPGARPDDASSVLDSDGWRIAYRLPGSDDLVAALDAAGHDRDAAVVRLLERCVSSVTHDGAAAAATDLPPRVVEALQQEMARLDPAADTRVVLECAACGHRFERPLDIGSYLWDELDDWAERTLAEVHVLALAYGWSETEILALSAPRRRHYLACVQQT
jgi:DnaJ-domain-containing protein 1